ncbi:MAG: diaminopimelate decarboxylase [Mucinivorans sp.]
MKYALNDHIPPTPFYYYDMELLEQTLGRAQAASERYGYRLHYAMKANVEPRILKSIARHGMGADCVSGWEVEAALKGGFPASKIVFAGVGKSDSEMVYALEKEIFCFNCESLEELQVLSCLAAKHGVVARVALRINPDVEPQTHKYISTGHGASKFGIAYNEVEKFMAARSHFTNIKVVGLHFHIGSQIVKLEYFEQLAQKAASLCRWFEQRGLPIEHLNMGGGLGINYQNPDSELIPDFEGYMACFARHLPQDKTIHFELGRSLVAQCGELLTRVLYTKNTVSGDRFIIVDAGLTELIRPALYAAHHHIENLSGQGRTMERYYIGGPICESSDIFAHDIEFPLSHRGDLLTIRSTGAYGSIMSSHYNCRPLAATYFSDNE